MRLFRRRRRPTPSGLNWALWLTDEEIDIIEILIDRRDCDSVLGVHVVEFIEKMENEILRERG